MKFLLIVFTTISVGVAGFALFGPEGTKQSLMSAAGLTEWVSKQDADAPPVKMADDPYEEYTSVDSQKESASAADSTGGKTIVLTSMTTDEPEVTPAVADAKRTSTKIETPDETAAQDPEEFGETPEVTNVDYAAIHAILERYNLTPKNEGSAKPESDPTEVVPPEEDATEITTN